jgi:hypothetical protein
LQLAINFGYNSKVRTKKCYDKTKVRAKKCNDYAKVRAKKCGNDTKVHVKNVDCYVNKGYTKRKEVCS